MHVTYNLGSVLFWRRYDILCNSGFMDDVNHVCNCKLWHDIGDAKMRILKVTQRGQQEFDITAYTETGLQDTASMIHDMALFVCLLSVCPRAYRRDYTPDFRQILCMLPSVAQCSPPLAEIVICCVIPVLLMAIHLHNNEPYGSMSIPLQRVWRLCHVQANAPAASYWLCPRRRRSP